MKPKDLFMARLEEHVVAFMAGHSFTFAKSRLRFARKAGQVKQTIEICLDRYNSQDNCTFWTMWSANAPAYLEWHKKEWSGEEALGDTLGSLADWNIPGWSCKPADPRRTLLNTEADAQTMAAFRGDIENVGLPFLERISTWEGAAEQWRKERWMYDRAADFLLLAGRRDEAQSTILEGIRAFESEGRHDTFDELPRLKRRLARYFG
jgi:hypothetical protein